MPTIAFSKTEFLKLNVGGESFELSSARLQRWPGSLLHQIVSATHTDRLQLVHGFIRSTGEYYFERSPVTFRYILHRYHYVDGPVEEAILCPTMLQEELRFWGFEGVMFISVGCLLATIVILIVESMPQYRAPNAREISSAVKIMEAVDSACVVWFTLEYVLRLLCTSHPWQTFKHPLSIIDLLAILPFYVELLVSSIGGSADTLGGLRRGFVIVRLVKVLRAFRILKVARYSLGFQSMGETIRRSWRELSMLILFMMTTTLIFATVMYFVEGDVNPKFGSIPLSAWWSIITMTTVGYGDVYPVTTIGKLLAAMVAISGIILLAFPISIIVDNFGSAYYETTKRVPASIASMSRTNSLRDPSHMHTTKVMASPRRRSSTKWTK